MPQPAPESPMPQPPSALIQSIAGEADLTTPVGFYWQLGEAICAEASALPAGPLVARWQALLLWRLDQLAPHRADLAALFGRAMHPQAMPQPWGQDDPMYTVCEELVQNATDAPQASMQADLATTFYVFHLMVIVFWLYDRTTDARATRHLVAFMAEALKLARPFFLLPLFGGALRRLAMICRLLFGLPEPATDDPAA